MHNVRKEEQGSTPCGSMQQILFEMQRFRPPPSRNPCVNVLTPLHWSIQQCLQLRSPPRSTICLSQLHITPTVMQRPRTHDIYYHNSKAQYDIFLKSCYFKKLLWRNYKTVKRMPREVFVNAVMQHIT